MRRMRWWSERLSHSHTHTDLVDCRVRHKIALSRRQRRLEWQIAETRLTKTMWAELRWERESVSKLNNGRTDWLDWSLVVNMTIVFFFVSDRQRWLRAEVMCAQQQQQRYRSDEDAVCLFPLCMGQNKNKNNRRQSTLFKTTNCGLVRLDLTKCRLRLLTSLLHRPIL